VREFFMRVCCVQLFSRIRQNSGFEREGPNSGEFGYTGCGRCADIMIFTEKACAVALAAAAFLLLLVFPALDTPPK
jgi:hypothetical protein